MKADSRLVGLGLFLAGLAGAIEVIIEYNDYERLRKHIIQIYKTLDAHGEAIQASADGVKYLLRNAKLEENKE